MQPYIPDGAEDAEPIIPKVDKTKVVTGGILRDIRVVVGKENNRMGFAVLEDKFGTIEVALYGAVYENYKTLFAEDSFLVVKGFISESRDGYKINVRELVDPHTKPVNADNANLGQTQHGAITLWLKMDTKNQQVYQQVLTVLQGYEGDIPVKFRIDNKNFAMETTVRKCNGIIYELEALLGEGNAKFVEKQS